MPIEISDDTKVRSRSSKTYPGKVNCALTGLPDKLCENIYDPVLTSCACANVLLPCLTLTSVPTGRPVKVTVFVSSG